LKATKTKLSTQIPAEERGSSDEEVAATIQKVG